MAPTPSLVLRRIRSNQCSALRVGSRRVTRSWAFSGVAVAPSRKARQERRPPSEAVAGRFGGLGVEIRQRRGLDPCRLLDHKLRPRSEKLPCSRPAAPSVGLPARHPRLQLTPSYTHGSPQDTRALYIAQAAPVVGLKDVGPATCKRQKLKGNAFTRPAPTT